MDSPSTPVKKTSADDTLDVGSASMDVLAHMRDSDSSPRLRRISQYDNSLRRLPIGDDEDSSSESSGELARLQAAVSLGGDKEDSSDSEELEALVKASNQRAAKKTMSSTTTDDGNDGSPKSAAQLRQGQQRAPSDKAKGLRQQLKFLGKQFLEIESLDVKHVVENEKAKQEVYTFEWEANEQRPEWKQGLLLATR